MANATNSCGCCEGTKAVTPQTLANRPGLAELAYRVGTHATFLETMLARLSSLALAVPAAKLDENGQPKVQRIYPLRNLTTRASDDPAIAFLDAWATVADVLTFYQERIANEGYLRTATERRSVLELARLIGYALRPGVAASTWLALELDKDYEVTIQPYELKAQSVPGPGEMPQTFENIEPLEARNTWNKLQPRLTQPQTLQTIIPQETSAQPRLYVKGISTNLKPNDAVLITQGDTPCLVYRVAEVKPDPLNDRTLMTFQQAAERAGPSPAFAVIAKLADHYRDTDTINQYRVDSNSEMAQRVNSHLQTLSDHLRDQTLATKSIENAVQEALIKISEEKAMAEGEQYRRLTDWLTDMTRDLDTAAQGIQVALAREKARAFAEAIAPPTDFINRETDLDPLKNAMVGLSKPPSVPPRNALSLQRNIASTFARRADTGLQLTGTFDMRLRQSLPVTLANVKVTDDSKVHAYVFRAVARPFGHNAVPRPVLQGYDARYTTYEEWQIDDPLGKMSPGPIVTPNLPDGGYSQQAVEGSYHQPQKLYLDGEYKIQTSGWVLVEGPQISEHPLFLNLAKGEATASQLSLTAYGVSGKTTRLDLTGGKLWLTANSTSFLPVRETVVCCESEELTLADEPVEAPICGGDVEIELDGLYSGLQSGRWIIVSGERDDIVDGTNNKVRGVKVAELVMPVVVKIVVAFLNWPVAGMGVNQPLQHWG